MRRRKSPHLTIKCPLSTVCYMTTQGKLYTVREVEGLTTLNETARLYDYKAVEKLEALGKSKDEAQSIVAAASTSGAGTGSGVMVLAASY